MNISLTSLTIQNIYTNSPLFSMASVDVKAKKSVFSKITSPIFFNPKSLKLNQIKFFKIIASTVKVNDADKCQIITNPNLTGLSYDKCIHIQNCVFNETYYESAINVNSKIDFKITECTFSNCNAKDSPLLTIKTNTLIFQKICFDSSSSSASILSANLKDEEKVDLISFIGTGSSLNYLYDIGSKICNKKSNYTNVGILVSAFNTVAPLTFTFSDVCLTLGSAPSVIKASFADIPSIDQVIFKSSNLNPCFAHVIEGICLVTRSYFLSTSSDSSVAETTSSKETKLCFIGCYFRKELSNIHDANIEVSDSLSDSVPPEFLLYATNKCQASPTFYQEKNWSGTQIAFIVLSAIAGIAFGILIFCAIYFSVVSIISWHQKRQQMRRPDVFQI